MKDKSRLTADIPRSLFLRLKAKLVAGGVSIQQWVIKMATKETEK